MNTTTRRPATRLAIVLALTLFTGLLFNENSYAADDGLTPVCSGPEGQRAFEDLANLYNKKQKIDYSKALIDQNSANPAVAASATSYLFALLKQSRADETNGRSKAERAPFVHMPFVMFSRYFRKALEDELLKTTKGPSSVSLAEWMILEENRCDAIDLLKRADDSELAKPLERILKQPWSRKDVTVATIELIGSRKIKELAPLIVPFGNHYRASVREAAAKTGKMLEVEVSAYNPEKAFSPWLESELQTIHQMLLPVPPESQFGIYNAIFELDGSSYIVFDTVGLPHLRDNAKKPPEERSNLKTYTGWKLSSRDGKINILDSNGSYTSLNAKTTSFTPLTLKEEALRIVSATNQKKFPWRVVGSSNAWQGKRQPVVIGACLLKSGDRATSAEILFPFIDALEDDRMLVGEARAFLGDSYGDQMLRDFQKRDYRTATLLSAQVSKPVFAGNFYHSIGQDMTTQLRTRSNDFKTFKLPTPMQWAAMKHSMSRDAELKFLATHLRLINATQHSNPGCPNFHATQYANNEGLGVPEGSSGAEVINPYNELIKTVKTPHDIEVLIPYLRDKTFFLSVQNGRFSLPSFPYRVQTLVADVINWCAGKSVVDHKKIGSSDSRKQLAHIDEIARWVKTPSLKLHPKPLEDVWMYY